MAEVPWSGPAAVAHCGWTDDTYISSGCTVGTTGVIPHITSGANADIIYSLWNEYGPLNACSTVDDCYSIFGGPPPSAYNYVTCPCWLCPNYGPPEFNCCVESANIAFLPGATLSCTNDYAGVHSDFTICVAAGYSFEIYCDESIVCWSAIYQQTNGEKNMIRGPGRLPKTILLPQANLNKPVQLIEDGIEMPSENVCFIPD